MLDPKFQCVVCIPARMGSTRLQGKVLLDLGGKAVVHHVYDRAKSAANITDVVILTDHQEVIDYCNRNNLKVLLTSASHENGTERCAEAASILADCTHIINVQGDEPFIPSENIEQLVNLLYQGHSIATLVTRFLEVSDIHNPSKVKVAMDNRQRALYFSRSPIPFFRDIDPMEWLNHTIYYAHIGIYGFQRETLIKLSKLSPGTLETAEKLEQLRWLENGFQIQLGITSRHSYGIDTQEDYEKAMNIMKEK
jgi:3-deoxy-manno-octulosonate cytidylyltransferase (CMP-KDO synthetase)